MVIAENIEPYADGQRITLKIGNPYNVNFNGFKASFSYGDLQERQSKEESFTNVLRAGGWTSVRIILPKLTKEHLATIEFSMEMNSISLR